MAVPSLRQRATWRVTALETPSWHDGSICGEACGGAGLTPPKWLHCWQGGSIVVSLLLYSHPSSPLPSVPRGRDVTWGEGDNASRSPCGALGWTARRTLVSCRLGSHVPTVDHTPRVPSLAQEAQAWSVAARVGSRPIVGDQPSRLPATALGWSRDGLARGLYLRETLVMHFFVSRTSPSYCRYK